MSSSHDKAWSDFWAQNTQSGQDGGCLPAKYQGIDAAQRAVWHGFAKSLPRKAALLDIATGDGRVMRWILGKRPDLKPVGVDMAPELPAPPKGTKVRGGVRMEELPFPDDKFDAVTSQFGFEYGDLSAAATEIARVLRPEGSIGLITHRIDGPILAHNVARREQILWAIEEHDLVAVAKGNLKLRASGLQTVSSKIMQAPAAGAARFGQGSAAWEIAEAVRQTLALSTRDHPDNVSRLLDTIRDHALNEIGRINSLEAACKQTADAAGFAEAIDVGGLEQVSVDALIDNVSTKPFADFRLLRKKS
ncbi:class I SAM-dependent methyltransferase [Pontixanthobacter aquaemixtae]|uniref:Methyltransferase domain-containing protein n=1 Tax=Pontixanthobacter aquaemixtae TaxID=1958940 RepID=A0A844ZM53_9SPHN|nr:class I SAM-dependent methyltransferase [Pontixanthobacter aquaemixtae]MXO89481.1 methyltransferase domain-containing protein [Pontixanthobacter aquaemixtae]